MPEGPRVVGERHDRHQGVAVGHLQRGAARDQVALDRVAVGTGAAQHEGQLQRVDAGAVEHDQPGHLGGQPGAQRGHGVEHRPQHLRPVPLQQGPAGVDAGQDGAARAGRVPDIEGRVESRPVDAVGAGKEQRPLRPGRQRLVGTGHQGVSALRQRMVGQRRMEAEVRRPCRVDDQRGPVAVGDRGEAGDVAHRADVRRVPDEDRRGVGRPVESLLQRRRGQAERDAPAGVHLGAHPDRLQPRQHQADEQRAVQRAADDHPLPRDGDGQRGREVGVGRAGDGEPTAVGSPQRRRPRLGHGEQPGRVLHARQPAVERHVAGHHVAEQPEVVLVTGDRERRQLALVEPQPRVQQRCVGAQLAGVGGHARSVGDAPASGKRAFAAAAFASVGWGDSRVCA